MNIKDITIRCADDYLLGATHYETDQAKGAILMAPATGIKRIFYKNFATHLMENGYHVITYDNRGIGDSLRGSVSQSDATLVQWGELDLNAAFDHLQTSHPDQKYHIVGHSAGGQLIGLMPEWRKLSSVFNVACSSGKLKNLRFPFSIQGMFFMHVFIPLSNLFFGHTKSQWVGMGEPLPKMVGKQWAEWCSGNGYIQTAFGKTVHKHWYDEMTTPSMWLNASDDDIATTENVDNMIKVFGKLPTERIYLKPEEQNTKEIGHMKFFSKRNKHLWSLATDWLAKH